MLNDNFSQYNDDFVITHDGDRQGLVEQKVIPYPTTYSIEFDYLGDFSITGDEYFNSLSVNNVIVFNGNDNIQTLEARL